MYLLIIESTFFSPSLPACKKITTFALSKYLFVAMCIKKGLIIVTIIAVGYFTGNFVPVKALVPNIDWDKKIGSGELVYYLICFIQAVGTIAAVLVALFSENIKGYFRKPALTFQLRNCELIEELDNSGGRSKKAKRYHNSIDVFNGGNINAESCEVCLDGISFSGLGANNPIELLQNEETLYWSSNEQRNKTYIPIQGKKSFQIFEISPPEEQGTPGRGNIVKIPPRLVIGNYKVPDEYLGGKWEVKISLFTPVLKPQKIIVTIEWNGRWEDRQMEMKNHVKNTIEIL